jgi:hypothetical protein
MPNPNGYDPSKRSTEQLKKDMADDASERERIFSDPDKSDEDLQDYKEAGDRYAVAREELRRRG